jgi:surface protein
MNKMFYNCNSLIELDLSKFITENVTSMKEMFCDCTSLKLLNLSNFTTNNVGDDLDWMFKNIDSNCKIIINDKKIGRIWMSKKSIIV